MTTQKCRSQSTANVEDCQTEIFLRSVPVNASHFNENREVSWEYLWRWSDRISAYVNVGEKSTEGSLTRN